MLLPAAGHQEFLGLRVAIETQRLVLLQDLLERDPHAILVLAGLGFNGEGDGGLGELHGRITDQGALLGEGVAGKSILQLRHGADVARAQLGHRLDGLAGQTADVGQPLRAASPDVGQVGIVLQHARADLEIRHPAGEGIRHRLEDKGRDRFGVGDGPLNVLPVQLSGPGAPLDRGGEVVDHEVQDEVGADIVQGGSAQHREEPHLPDRRPQAFRQAFRGQRSLFEELLHQGVIALRHHLDERFLGFLGRFGQVLGDLSLLAPPASSGFVGVALHPDQVDDAAELALRAERQLDGDGEAAEILLDAGEGPVEAGVLPVQLVDDQRPRQFELLGERPHLLGLNLDAGDPVHQHQGGVGGHQRGPRVIDEDVEAGRVQKVDFALVPLGEGQRGGDGDLALDLLVVEVGDGGALVHARQPVGGSRQEQDAGGE